MKNYGIGVCGNDTFCLSSVNLQGLLCDGFRYNIDRSLYYIAFVSYLQYVNNVKLLLEIEKCRNCGSRSWKMTWRLGHVV